MPPVPRQQPTATARPARERVPHQGLFREPVYADGPYAREDEEGDDD
ncbi:hypothetical protein [Streptomyces sp. NPDC056982]